MPEKELAEMRSAFEQAKQFAGLDPTKVDYIVLAVRFRKPSAELAFMPPEYMAVASGDFSSESLLGLARSASGGAAKVVPLRKDMLVLICHPQHPFAKAKSVRLTDLGGQKSEFKNPKSEI